MKSLNGLRDQYQTKQRDYTGRNNKHQTKIISKVVFLLLLFFQNYYENARVIIIGKILQHTYFI